MFLGLLSSFWGMRLVTGLEQAHWWAKLVILGLVPPYCWVEIGSRVSGLDLVPVHWCVELGAGPSGSLGSRQAGLSGWRMQAQYLQRAGLVALWNVRYSQNSDQVPVPCLGTRTPNHWAPEEGPACRSGDCGFVAQSEVKDPDLLQLFSSPKVALSLQALCVLDRF